VAALAVAACAVLAAAVPAEAAKGGKPGRPTTTTTTTAPSTTTTAPTSTTTSSPTSSSTTSTTAPTTTTTTVPTSPCGASIPKATGGTWQCTWADDFDGTGLDRTKWVPQTTGASGFTDGTSCFVDTPDNVSVGDGVLTLTARKEAAPFTCHDPSHGDYTTQYTTGMVSTYRLFSQAYGRFEVRAKLPPAAVAGLQESFWLWPDNPIKYGYVWPQSGEIDIAEIYSRYADRAIPYVHYVPATVDPNVTNNYCLVDDISRFHTYAVEWTTSTITIIYDGQTCLVDSWNPASPLVKPQPFDQPFMVALTQALGVGGNAFDPATTPLPAVTQVDYVHVWK
jgi:beta-glucanase (GH16 family)